MDYAAFIKKIDDFIRKYYLNKVVRGSIWLCAFFLLSFLILVTAEYFGYYSVATKTFLFYFFILAQLVLAWLLVGKHLAKYLKLGKTINHEQASHIIGNHFPEIKDKLTNTLQLQKTLSANPQQQDLILAGINQKVSQMQPVPFISAVKIAENKKYLRYAIVPLVIILIIAIISPALLKDGTTRIIKHNEYFVKKAPFEFQLLNKNLNATQGEDFLLKLKLNGNEIPQEIYIEDGVNSFKLKKDDIINFSYLFKNIQENTSFRFKAGEFYSDYYLIKVNKKPALLNFKVSLSYPAYLNKKSEVLDSPGDITIPEGTNLSWTFITENTNELHFQFLNKNYTLLEKSKNQFFHQLKAKETGVYTLQPINNGSKENALSHQLNVIPDAFPQINLEEKPDSSNSRVLYFIGKANDDYGISKLNFYYQVTKTPDAKRLNKLFKLPIKINPAKDVNFFYFWQLNKCGILAGEEITYYFEVIDNDGVNGPKSTFSDKKIYSLLTKQESLQKIDESNASVQQKIQSAMRQAQKIQEEAKKLNQESLNTNSLDYEQKKQAEQLFEKQKKLEDFLKEISKESKQNLLEKKQLDTEEKLIEKQKQIQDLFDNVLDEKTKELLKNLQKLMDEKNQNSQQNEFKQTQADNKSLEKELNRILELYKKLEVEQKIKQSINDLKELSKEQKQNIKEGKFQKQEEINKKFSDIKSDLKEAEKKDESLDSPQGFKVPEEQQKAIEEKLKDASQNLQKNDKGKANDSQKDAAEKMEEMANSLQQMQDDGEEEQNTVDAQGLRQILQNVLKSSFDQEKLMLDMRKTDINDPRFKEIGQKQRDIKDNLKIVEDSLYSLSKRVPQIASTVNKEIAQINQQITDALEHITDRKKAEANRNQQYALTSINNLSLMLSEALQQLQKAMKNAKSGGKGKPQPGMSQLSKMQEQLNKNMQKAKEQMQQQGIQPGKSGNTGKEMSKEFSEMAQQQHMIRQALQEMNQKLNKDGKGKLGDLEKIMKEMEQTETDLVNKRITQESMLRQQSITTRLLEAEKAEREREQDTEKESRSGKEFAPNYNLILKEYEKRKEKDVEMLKTVPPALNNFYKSKISDYFKKLNTGK